MVCAPMPAERSMRLPLSRGKIATAPTMPRITHRTLRNATHHAPAFQASFAGRQPAAFTVTLNSIFRPLERHPETPRQLRQDLEVL